MNAVELHEYMQNPDLLTEDTLADIRHTMNSYPAFPALKMLYLQNLWKVNSPDFKRELEQLAIGRSKAPVCSVERFAIHA